MATIPTPEECAMRILLELYYKNDKRSGDGYNKGYFMGLIGKGWRNDDLNNGLTLCIEKGWLEENKKRFIYPTEESVSERRIFLPATRTTTIGPVPVQIVF